MNHSRKTHTICYGCWKTSLRGSKQEGHFATALMTTKKKLSGTHGTILCHHWMFIELLSFSVFSLSSPSPSSSAQGTDLEGKVHRDDRLSVCEWEQTMFVATRCVEDGLVRGVLPRMTNLDVHCRVPTANTTHQDTRTYQMFHLLCHNKWVNTQFGTSNLSCAFFFNCTAVNQKVTYIFWRLHWNSGDNLLQQKQLVRNLNKSLW